MAKHFLIKLYLLNFLILYYSDTLYDYENINYNSILQELDKIDNYHSNDINTKLYRVESVKACIENLKNHLILFDSHEQFMLNNSSIEIENIINKMNPSNVEKYYLKLIHIILFRKQYLLF